MNPMTTNSSIPHGNQPLLGFTVVDQGAWPPSMTRSDSSLTGYIITNFTLNQQQQSNWCWLATTSDVHNFYQPGSLVTQCALAGQILFNNPMQCCNRPVPAQCNQPGLPSVALQTMNNLNSNDSPFSINALSFSMVKNQVSKNLPIVLGYTMSQEHVGHAVLILGYAEKDGEAGQIYVGDPARGFLWGTFADLLFTYSPYSSQVCFTHS